MKRTPSAAGDNAVVTLDQWWPPRGPCAFCGHADARHRDWDAIIDSPGSDEEIAADFELPVVAVHAVKTIRPFRRRRSKK